MNIYIVNIILGALNCGVALVEHNWFAAAGWVCSVIGWLTVEVVTHD